MPFSSSAIQDESSAIYRRSILRSGATAGVGIVALAGCAEQTEPGEPAGTDATPPRSPTADGRTRTETSSPTEETETAEEPESTEEAGKATDEETPAAASTWFVRPDGQPRRVPSEWVCDDDQAEREPQRFDEASLSWGDDPEGRWRLRIDDVEFEHGASVHVRLRNVSDEEQTTGNRGKYNLQIETADGWEDVRVWRDGQPKPHPDEAVRHDPGDGFDWQFEVTEEAFTDQEVTVCPDLETARYRFAYEYDEEMGIAVGFDLDVA